MASVEKLTTPRSPPSSQPQMSLGTSSSMPMAAHLDGELRLLACELRHWTADHKAPLRCSQGGA